MRTRIGRYRLLEKIGEGGMGEVFVAEDPDLGRRVAIKTLHGDVADATGKERMRREARAAAAVSHPGICQIHEVGEVEGDTFLAMELLEGEPLSTRLERGPLPLREALGTSLALLDALSAIHRHGLVHRDLKPANVFLTPHGPKILDFGLALPVEGDASNAARLTRIGMLVGTPGYMAPEQWTGGEVSPRTDLFAAGAILLEMIAGRPAFEGRNVPEFMESVLHSQPPTLTGGGAVPAVDRLVQRSLSKEATERFASAEEMAAGVRSLLAALDGSERADALSLRRLLVIPFRPLGEEGESAFLAQGLADALSLSLSGIEGLAVQSARAGARYAREEPDLSRIARETQVQLVLTGTLLRAGGKLRVHAELLRAPEGTIAWARKFEAPEEDLFGTQDRIAAQIVDSLSLDFARRRAPRADAPATPKAYEYFLRAQQLSYNFGKLSEARELFRLAVAEDPGYAPAWARLGRVSRVMAKYGHGDPDALLAEAASALERALALNPDLPAAHNHYAHYEIEELGRSKEAMVRLLGRARRSPTDADLWAGLVVACRFCGLLDASLEADRRARRLDPGVRTSASYTLWMRGEYEEALRRDDEDHGWMTFYALPLLGRSEEAARRGRLMEARAGSALERNVFTSNRAAIEGDRAACAEATRALADSAFRDPEGIFCCARNLIHVGEADPGLALLDRAVGRGFHCVAALRNDPWLEPVRGDARFRAILDAALLGHEAARAAYREAGGEALLG